MARLSLLLSAVLLLSSCGGADAGPPPSPAVDLGGESDLGMDDLGLEDASAPDDAGPVDGGAPPVDAGPPDAGPPDLGPMSMPCTAAGACDPFDPTSCGAGLGCRLNDTGMTECLPVIASPREEGSACTTSRDCQPGLVCLDFGGGFACNRMCPRGSIGFCGGEDRCFGTLGDACVQVCRPRPEPCDIYAQDCPNPADACTLASDPETRAPYTGCRPNGTVGIGGFCGGMAGSCQRGLICIREGSSSTCKQVCGPDGGTPACTAAGEVCTGFARTWGVSYCRAP
jgi:hypothetical protein